MKKRIRALALALAAVLALGTLAGCGSASAADGKYIIRIGHNQSTNHPTHTGLLAFEEYIETAKACFRGFIACFGNIREGGVVAGSGTSEKGDVRKSPAMQASTKWAGPFRRAERQIEGTGK